MDINILEQAVTSFGFPIVCVFALGWFIWYLTKVGQQDKEKLYAELAENRIINQSFVSTLQAINAEVQDVRNEMRSMKEDVEVIKNKIE